MIKLHTVELEANEGLKWDYREKGIEDRLGPSIGFTNHFKLNSITGSRRIAIENLESWRIRNGGAPRKCVKQYKSEIISKSFVGNL